MAGSSGAIRAGRAFIELFAEDSALGRGLRAARAKLVGFGAGINALGASIGSGISSALTAISKGVKLASVGVAAVAGGLLFAAKSFADADRSMMTGDQAAAADAMKTSFTLLGESAAALRNTLGTALQPAISAIIDIARIGMNAFREWIATNGELIAGITDFIAGIRDALSAGDIQLAGEILWAGLKVVWAAGINAIIEPWVEWKTAFQQTASEAFLGLLNIADFVWEEMTSMARTAGDFISNVFNGAVDKLAKGLTIAGEAIGVFDEGTTEELARGQERDAKQRATKRKDRDQQIAAARRKSEEEFGETVNSANQQIADANRQAISQAQQDLDKAKSDLQALQKRAKDGAKPVENEIAKKQEDAVKLSAQSVFGGTRLAINSGDATGRKIENHTKKTADNTQAIADRIGSLTGGIAVTA